MLGFWHLLVASLFFFFWGTRWGYQRAWGVNQLCWGHGRSGIRVDLHGWDCCDFRDSWRLLTRYHRPVASRVGILGQNGLHHVPKWLALDCRRLGTAIGIV